MKYIVLVLMIACTKIYSQGLHPSEFLINSTVKIECQKEINGKKLISSGTGFFFTLSWKNGSIPVLVTNKHVIKDAINATVHFKEWNSNGQPIYGQTAAFNLGTFWNAWILHPDSTVDLAILPMNHLEKLFNKSNKRIQYTSFSEGNMLNDSISNTMTAIEEIYMIGYPHGLRDEANDIPIVRKGITGTPMFLNYRKRKEFLIDMPVYRGSSGSPIVVYGNMFNNRVGGTSFGQRVFLAGINFATYYKTFDGKLVPKKTDSIDSLQTQTSLPLYNIGIVIKAERLLEFKKLFPEMETHGKK